MGSKRGPLSKAEKFYITEHAKANKDINEIAIDLDRPVKSIEPCYTKAQKEKASGLTAGDQFAKHKGSIVMTENASTLADAKKRRFKTPTLTPECITKAKK